MAITMTIAGVAFSPSSIEWNYTARNRGTATIKIPYRTNGAIARPAVSNEVIILSGATRLFAGRVVDIDEGSFVHPDASAKPVEITISVSDYNLYTTRLVVHEVFYPAGTATRKQILQDLIAFPLGLYFGTTLGTVTNGPVFDDLRFDNVTVEDMLNHITTLTQEVWYIDENNVLQCSAVGTTSTGLSLTESNTLTSQVQYQRTQYANIVNVIAGPEDTHEVIDTFTAAATSFVLTPYTYVSSRGYVIETVAGNDTYLPLGVYAVDPTVWTIDTTTTPPTLHRTSSLPGGTTATFTYTAKFPFAVQAQNTSEVSGQGPWELNIRAENIVDYDAALAYATALVGQTSVNARILVEVERRALTVLVPRPGQTLTLSLPTRGVSSATYVIVSVGFSFEPTLSRTMRQTLSLTSGTSLPRTWEEFFGGAAAGSGGGTGGILTGTVATNLSGMFDTDVVAHSGEADEVSLRQNAVGTSALISNSSCVGPAVVIGAPYNSWSWALIANYQHLASGRAGGVGRRALCFFYVPGGSSSANTGAMSLTQDSAGTAGVFYLTPENPSAVLNIGSPASGVGVGFRVNVYADVADVTSATINSLIIGALVGTFGNNFSYDGANQLIIGIPGTTSAKKLVLVDSAGNSQFGFDAVGNMATNGTIKERGRSTPLGEWVSPSFSAGDYTGSGTITWTVASGDVTTFAYSLVGKTMTVSLVLQTTTVSGAGAVLQVAIPGGFTAAKAMRNACEAVDNAVRTTARIGVTAGGTLLLIQRTDAANWAAATDATAISAQLVFEVQ